MVYLGSFARIVTVTLWAEEYLHGCPAWFVPPIEGTDGSIKNEAGVVAWTNLGLIGPNGEHESKDSFIEKIKKATVENQTNWNQYLDAEEGGYPMGSGDHNAGFICYALVYRAANNARWVFLPRPSKR